MAGNATHAKYQVSDRTTTTNAFSLKAIAFFPIIPNLLLNLSNELQRLLVISSSSLLLKQNCRFL
ncbi:hypothetical protein NIES4075_14860 [Tolypothrix sp. NIES-4075]|uniref:hypothetical protein n=1 Tax=Tolypothrix sp. NIES-4075 TaxID=2005459 RepID=UPI000B6F8DED|nr:hypothetical protein [Tolypothrix sp. NIES-4075]GAX40520.1 hypothetical protein NIES4075_14860 [Tolypothrix sp. NIES-4075]